jgi:methionyl-tRNA formyltransferase
MKNISTIFVGTSYEGVSSLESLVASDTFSVSAVITQPDKPAGRKQTLTPSPIKEAALAHELPVHTTEEDNIYETVVDTYSPDLAVTIAFGDFLPETFLNALPHKCLNVHYSLLPILRGAVPVQMAILQGHRKTGVSIQIMEKTMDTGPILAQKEVPITSRETTPSLKEKLIPEGKALLMETLPKWVEERIPEQEQNHAQATYCYMSDISKDSAEIDWKSMEPDHIERMVRAFLPWPVVWTTLPNGKRLKIFESKLKKIPSDIPVGKTVPSTRNLTFSTKSPGTGLEVLEGQVEGKTRMSGEQIQNGLKS